MSTFVAIPCRGHFEEFTEPLLRHLLDHEPSVRQVLLLDNGSTDGTFEKVCAMDNRILPFYLPDDNLAQLWNRAIKYASLGAEGERDNLVIANNDLTLAPNTIAALTDALRSEPGLWAVSPNPERRVAEGIDQCGIKQVRGTYRLGGITGWCFALAAEHWRGIAEPVDESFEWWGQDDDLMETIQQRGGRLARVLGVPCDHIGSGTANDGMNDWTEEAKSRDRERFVAKWGKAGW